MLRKPKRKQEHKKVLKLITNTAQALIFYLSVLLTRFKEFSWRPFTKQQHKVKATKIAYKPGESYRLGQCVVTLATFGIEGKEEVRKKIEAYNALRILKHQELTERAEKIMLMNPEELKQFQIDEWLEQRRAFNEKKYYENTK